MRERSFICDLECRAWAISISECLSAINVHPLYPRPSPPCFLLCPHRYCCPGRQQWAPVRMYLQIVDWNSDAVSKGNRMHPDRHSKHISNDPNPRISGLHRQAFSAEGRSEVSSSFRRTRRAMPQAPAQEMPTIRNHSAGHGAAMGQEGEVLHGFADSHTR